MKRRYFPLTRGKRLREANFDSTWDSYLKGRSDYDRNALVEHYMPLVDDVINSLIRTLPPYIDVQELSGPGNMGLLQAVINCDSKKLTVFDHYARKRIKGSVLDHLRSLDFMPRTRRIFLKKSKKAELNLNNKLGRKCTDEELCKYMGMSYDDYYKKMSEAREVESLEYDDFGTETASNDLRRRRLLLEDLDLDPQIATTLREVSSIARDNLSDEDYKMLTLRMENRGNEEIGISIRGLAPSTICARLRKAVYPCIKEKLGEGYEEAA
ncbi:MAG: sigma-70 domain-containing protein [Nanoarchaeota archaeon]